MQPEMDILYAMFEPKLQVPDGVVTLAALGDEKTKGQCKPFPSVLEFHWGTQELPVLMTQLQFEVKAFLPNLLPYRAEATLTLQIIQSVNKLYTKEMQRVYASAQQASGALQGYQSKEA